MHFVFASEIYISDHRQNKSIMSSQYHQRHDSKQMLLIGEDRGVFDPEEENSIRSDRDIKDEVDFHWDFEACKAILKKYSGKIQVSDTEK